MMDSTKRQEMALFLMNKGIVYNLLIKHVTINEKPKEQC